MSQIGLLGAFLGGLLALLSPCSALLLPSFFAYAFDGAGKLAGRTGIFYLGLAAVLVPLGAGVGAIGSAITRYREVTTMIGGRGHHRTRSDDHRRSRLRAGVRFREQPRASTSPPPDRSSPSARSTGSQGSARDPCSARS